MDLGSNCTRFLINLIALGIATVLPFLLSFGPFVAMVCNNYDSPIKFVLVVF